MADLSAMTHVNPRLHHHMSRAQVAEIADREPRRYRDVPALAAALRIVSGLILRHTRDDTAVAELSLTQVSILARLERGGAMSPAALAKIERLRPQTIRNVVDGLRARGLVVGERDSVDGRRIRLSLTEEGRGWVRGVRTTAEDSFLTRAMVEQLSSNELATLAEALKLLERITFAPAGLHSTHRDTPLG